jgi:Spy/CpxP family protein refolding chaperone
VNINWEVNRDILTENLSVEPFQSDTDTMRFRTYSYEARGEDQVKAVMYQQSKSKPHDAENKMKEVRLLNQTGV